LQQAVQQQEPALGRVLALVLVAVLQKHLQRRQ
jgi:hypothetical protein